VSQYFSNCLIFICFNRHSSNVHIDFDSLILKSCLDDDKDDNNLLSKVYYSLDMSSASSLFHIGRSTTIKILYKI
jgi:hypothetical protein